MLIRGNIPLKKLHRKLPKYHFKTNLFFFSFRVSMTLLCLNQIMVKYQMTDIIQNQFYCALTISFFSTQGGGGHTFVVRSSTNMSIFCCLTLYYASANLVCSFYFNGCASTPKYLFDISDCAYPTCLFIGLYYMCGPTSYGTEQSAWLFQCFTCFCTAKIYDFRRQPQK